VCSPFTPPRTIREYMRPRRGFLSRDLGFEARAPPSCPCLQKSSSPSALTHSSVNHDQEMSPFRDSRMAISDQRCRLESKQVIGDNQYSESCSTELCANY